MSIEILQPKNLSSEGISAGFFGRTGGVSVGVYESLNCGPGSNDDPAAVQENRKCAVKTLCKGDVNLCTLYQIHSNQVLIVDAPFEGRPKADALVTRTPGLALGILTADCAPVLLADEIAGVIGAAHAGWRGALVGIASETVKAMEALGATRENMKAAIGPCILQESYEVGAKFRDDFFDKDLKFSGFFAPRAKGRYQFDLEGFVEDQLKNTGVKTIEKLSLDTYTLEKRFFSYRRSVHRKEADYGRQLSAICLNPKAAI